MTAKRQPLAHNRAQEPEWPSQKGGISRTHRMWRKADMAIKLLYLNALEHFSDEHR